MPRVPRAHAAWMVLTSALFGCVFGAVAPVRPTVPPNPFSISELHWSQPAGTTRDVLWTYAEIPGPGSTRAADGVTVTVTPIVPYSADQERFREVLVDCMGPDDVPFPMSIVGRAVKFDIQNDTDQVITTHLSTLQIEDDMGTVLDVPHVTWDEWLRLVRADVRDRYQWYRDQVWDHEAHVESSLASMEWAAPQDYQREYDRYRSEHERCMLSVFGGASVCGSVNDVATLAPAALTSSFRAQARDRLRMQLQRVIARIGEIESNCLAGIEDRRLRGEVTLITHATLGGIRILPGRAMTGYVPLDPGFREEGPKVLDIGLYDLGLGVGSTGSPRRVSFEFRLERTVRGPVG